MSQDYSVVSTREAINASREMIAENKGWFIALGVVLIALGAVAMAFPFATTIATKVVLGWLFLLGGVMQIAHAFSTKNWSEFFLSSLIGLLYAVVGGWLAFFPLTGLLTLTVMLAALFIAEGVLKTLMAFRWRPRDGWGWILLSGLVSLVLGGIVIADLPGSATWVIGLLVGIDLVMAGIAYVFVTMFVGETDPSPSSDEQRG